VVFARPAGADFRAHDERDRNEMCNSDSLFQHAASRHPRLRRFHPGVPHQGHQIDKSVIESFLSPMYRVILVTHGGRQEEKSNHLRGTTIISLISETA